MMNLVDRDGIFKGRVLDHTVGKTKNGFPQLNIRLKATEFFDPTQSEWVSWEEYGQEIIGYAVLANDAGKLFKHDQIVEAFGWNGLSYAGLAVQNLSTVACQFQVEWNEYNGVKSLQVTNFGKVDGSVLGGLRGATPAELEDLDRKFLGKTIVPATPKTAPKPPNRPTVETTTIKKPKMVAVPAKPRCTKIDAWKSVNDLRLTDECDDAALRAAWTKAIAEIGEDETAFTPEQWEQVRNKTLDQIAHLPF
jgi:hypothetical protein